MVQIQSEETRIKNIGVPKWEYRYKISSNFIAICIVCVLGFLNNVNAQQTKAVDCQKLYDKSLDIYIYSTADKWAEFPDGGDQGFMKFFAQNFHMPAQFQGTLKLAFVVTADGKIIDKKIVSRLTNDKFYYKKPSEYSRVDSAGVKVLDLMPDWKPATCNGKPVAVRVHIPINF